MAMGDTARALSSRHPASIETSRPRADYHKHLYMLQRIILAYPARAKVPRCCRRRQRLVLGAGMRVGAHQAWLLTYVYQPALTSRRHASLIDL